MSEIKRKETENPIPVVAAVILDESLEKFLVGQRAETVSHAGKYEFIGGKLEPGELPEKALKREVKEEINLNIGVGRKIGSAPANYQDLGSFEISFYECHLISGKLQPRPEIYRDVRWVGVEELANLDWIRGDLQFAKSMALLLAAKSQGRN